MIDSFPTGVLEYDSMLSMDGIRELYFQEVFEERGLYMWRKE